VCPHPPVRLAIELDPAAPVCVTADFFNLGRPGNYTPLCTGGVPCSELNTPGLAPLGPAGIEVTWTGQVRIVDQVCTDSDPGACVTFWLKFATFPHFVEHYGQPFMAFGTRRALGQSRDLRAQRYTRA